MWDATDGGQGWTGRRVLILATGMLKINIAAPTLWDLRSGAHSNLILRMTSRRVRLTWRVGQVPALFAGFGRVFRPKPV
jgi:hypothetical protein